MKLYHIACMDKNRAIGRNGKLPFNCPLDMKRFRAITSGAVVVFGRKTYQSIGKPLPNRINIVLSQNNEWIEEEKKRYSETGHVPPYFFNSFIEALAWCKQNEFMEIYICGGQNLYARTLPYISELRLTILDQTLLEPDTYYPRVDPQMFAQVWYHDFDGGYFSDAVAVFSRKDLGEIDF